MARRKILISLPTLNDKKGDARKQWYVEYGVRNPRTDKLERFRIYEGLSVVAPSVRYKRAQKIIEEYTAKLKSGWSPLLENSKYIYQDSLVYSEVAKVFGNARLSNETARYWANEWLKQVAKRVDHEGTLPTYRAKLRLFANWLESKGLGENDVSSISNELIIQFFDFLVIKRDLSTTTQLKYRQILADLFEMLYKKKKIAENPVFDIEIVRNEKDQSARPMSDKDLKAFVACMKQDDPVLLLAFKFEYYCYLRPGKEVRKLKVGDIDLARGVINVERFRVKTNRPKFPTIPTVFLNELRNLYRLQDYPRDFYLFGQNYQPGPVHIGKNNLRFRFNRIRKKLNMPIEYKFYSGKHTGNARAMEIPEITIEHRKDQNGHASIVTTEIYTKNKLGKVIPSIRDHFPDIDN